MAPCGELSKGLKTNKTKSIRVTLEFQILSIRLLRITLVVKSKKSNIWTVVNMIIPLRSSIGLLLAKERLRYELIGVTHVHYQRGVDVSHVNFRLGGDSYPSPPTPLYRRYYTL